MKKVLVFLVVAVMMAGMAVTAFAEADYITVSAFDYTAVENNLPGASETGVVLAPYRVELREGDTLAAVIQRAFDENHISITGLEFNYVESINGLGSGAGYSGWSMAVNNDDYTNWGMESVALESGLDIRFDYTCNFDMLTDDVGNGWQGLPIVTEFSLDGMKAEFGRSSYYDQNYNLIASYYRKYKNNAQENLEGDGTEENPFIINIPVGRNCDITSLTAVYKTTLNEHYRIVEGLGENQDYTDGVEFSVSTLGGKYKAYYRAVIYRVNEHYADIRLSNNGFVKAEYSCFAQQTAKVHLAAYDSSGKLVDLKIDSVSDGIAFLKTEAIESGYTYKAFIWDDNMNPLY